MKEAISGSASADQWTLIRGARQLLTLRGASGARRGSAMSEVGVIADGAILIRNGLIEKVGTARQVENFAQARLAREVYAMGKIVMPAFVDPDIALAAPTVAKEGAAARSYVDTDIRRMSKRRLGGSGHAMAADLARNGVLTAGAHSLFAQDLPNTLKALRLHQSMQSKPLRIRSVFAPPWLAGDASGKHFERVSQSWMPAVLSKKLASILEVPVGAASVEDARILASAAAACGFNIRFRIAGIPTPEMLSLASAAGAIALLGIPPDNHAVARAMADFGCVQVVLAGQILSGKFKSARDAVNDGMPIALASGYPGEGVSSVNPQFLLFLACQNLDLTVEEAIVATTYNAACSLRFSQVTGSLGLGKSADICIMDVDDYRELARRPGHNDASVVMRAGKIVYRRPGLTLD